MKGHLYAGVKAAVTALLLPVLLAGCQEWRVATEPLPPPTHVRLVMVEGPNVELWNARVVGDSVVGSQESDRAIRLGVPLSKVKQVQRRAYNVFETSALVFVGVVGGAYLALIIWCTAFDGCQQ